MKYFRFLCAILAIIGSFHLVTSDAIENLKTWKHAEEVARNLTEKPVIERKLEIVKNDLQMEVLAQLLDIYVLNSTNVTCRQASDSYRDALINFEPWALKMLDASSKLQAGLIAGNRIEFGAFQQCIDVEAITDHNGGGIRGKHCTIPVLPSERMLKKIFSYRGITEKAYKNRKSVYYNVTYVWSLCMPDACGPKDIIEHFRSTVNELVDGLEVTFLDDEIKCKTYEDIDEAFDGKEITALSIVGILMIVVGISTFMEMYKRYYEIDRKGYETFFSIIANTRYIFQYNKNHKKMACLNGIRVFSIMLVVAGHRFLLGFFHSNTNGFEALDWMLNLTSQIILRGTVAVDSFLMLSAILVSYNFFLQHEKGVPFNLPKFYLNRYLRLTPSYAFWIFLVVCYSHRIGKGPEWDSQWYDVQQPCKDYWWSALLYSQSYVNPKEVCILQSWYLSIDMFYYVCAPVFLILIAKYKMLGMITLVLLYFASVGANFGKAWERRYPVQALVDSDLVHSDYFTEFYTLPHIRGAPYIMGIALGYLLFKTRDKKVKMSPMIVTIGWTLSVIIMFSVILTNRVYLDEDYKFDRFSNAFYHAAHRSIWSLAIGWLIWACVHGYGGFVNHLLSSDVFAILAKLTYSVYIVHMQFQFYDFGAMKMGGYFSNMSWIQKSISDVILSFVMGYFLAVTVECPIYRLYLLMCGTRRKPEPSA